MAGVNKVILVGNLGKDPESRTLNDGGKVVSLRLATSDTWRDKASGEKRERTEWHSVVIFNENLGKVAESYLRKGSKVYIEGALQTRKWTDKEGAEKFTTEIVLQKFGGALTLLDSRGDSDAGGMGDSEQSSYRASAPARSQPDRGGYSGGGGGGGGGRSGATVDDDLSDEVPF